MTKVMLLRELKTFTEAVIQDLRFPVQPQEEDELPPQDRVADVYIPRLPELRSYVRKAPFITHEIVTGKDKLDPDPRGGKRLDCTAVVRSCFCVYHPNEQEGTLALLTLMEQMRISLLERPVLGGQFTLDLDAGIETLVYPVNPNQTAQSPFYLGEMITTWGLPPVKRLDSTRIVHGMPPWDPNPRHLQETVKLAGKEKPRPIPPEEPIEKTKGSDSDGKENG